PVLSDRETSGESRYRHAYVHVPFCARRCSYCDFAIAVRKITPVADYLAALRGELETRFGGDRQRGQLETLYFGGGTPSRLGREGVAGAIATLRRHFDLAPNAELTVEANPENLDVETVSAWREAGVNRVSLGVQSFEPAVLSWMHRTHDVAAVYRAVEALRSGGIVNWSLDLIYALPPEVKRDWSSDLTHALALHPPHISAYGLTVEGGTPLARWRARGDVHDADDECFESDFLTAHDRLGEAGYLHYEVSNWGRPGLDSRHNSSYWRNVPYLGVGPGAHGYDGRVRRWNEREYARWRARILQGEDPIGGEEDLSSEQRSLEAVYVGLRTLSGVALLPGDAELVDRWVAEGWGAINQDRLVLSPRGWLRLDALVAALTEHRSRY
ncbi:MAG: radical SAM family heme chaperone HemW, partial [Gemmatimonadota bacterium]